MTTTIAVIGGTGAEGSGLAVRWAAAGHRVVIGSRSAEKAIAASAELMALLPPEAGGMITGTSNTDAAAEAEVVVLSVPYAAQVDTIAQIVEGTQGKILVTVVAPLMPPKVSTVWHVPGGSAAEEAQSQLGEGVRVVAAFQNVAAGHLKDLSWAPDCDVLVTSDDKEAKQAVIELAGEAGFFALDVGPLANASVVEGFTALLVGINARNKIKGAGIRITGVPRS